MLHQVELVVNARETSAIAVEFEIMQQARMTLARSPPGNHSGRLIIDATLEASGAPIHELNGTCTCAETIKH